MPDLQENKAIDIKETSSIIDRGLAFLFGKSKKTSIIGATFAILLGIVIYPESLGWIGISEVTQQSILGYIKFLTFISFLFFARLAKEDKKPEN